MTAIFGIVGKCSEHELEAMAARLRHRGDHSHIWSPASNVHFGEIRHDARQASEDGFLAVSAQLSVDWTDHAPSERQSAFSRSQIYRNLLSRAVSVDPVTAPSNLDGMFAYAYWEKTTSTLVLAVDRINFTRLYYTQTADRLIFATEYKALLALSDVHAVPDPDALQYAISTVVVDLTRTLATNIRRVPRCHVACISGHSIDLIPYWKAVSKPAAGNMHDAAQTLRKKLLAHVSNAALPYDRMAVTLSGGLDSAGLLGLIHNAHPDRTIATYTIGHSAEDPEISGARAAAAHFGTEHHEYFFQPESIIDDLPRLIWLTEEFAAREESILQYQVESQLIDREQVLISGNGADMVFGGMPRHRIIRLAETVPFARTPLSEFYQQTQTGQLPESLRGRLVSWLSYQGKNVPPPELLGATGPTRIPNPGSLSELIEQTIVRMTSLHYHTAVRSLSAIESLLPYLALPVLNFSLTLPSGYKTGIRRQKIVLREALSPLLPDFIKKRGKAIQRARHNQELTSVLNRMADSLLSRDAIRARGLVDPQYVQELRRSTEGSYYSGDSLARVWMLLATELWCRAFVDNRGAPFDDNYNNLRAGGSIR